MNIIYKDCEYCGRPTKPNVLASHESSCRLNPKNNFTETPQEFDKSKHYLNSQKLLLKCGGCEKSVEIGYAHLKNKYLKSNKTVLCRSCLQTELYKNEVWKRNRLEKIKETYRKTFGKESLFQTEYFKNKSKNTLKQKYGDLQNFYEQRNKEFWKNIDDKKLETRSRKCKETMLKRYGVEYFTPQKFYYKGLCFDSKAEAAFYIDHFQRGLDIVREPTRFTYEFENRKHFYYPDFKVGERLYEIKGLQFLNKDGSWRNPYGPDNGQMKAKHVCALQNNVEIIYVDKNFKKKFEKAYIALEDYLNGKVCDFAE